MQVPLQSVVPTGHSSAHAPCLHAVPFGQATPQDPQFALSLDVVAQEEPASPSQSDWPAAHVDEHVPFTQASSLPHAVPHAPQFLLSLSVFAQYANPASSRQSTC
jgi:hypothetical protein